MNKKLVLLLPLFLTTAVVAMESPSITPATRMETPQEIGQRYINLERLCTAITNNKASEVRVCLPLVEDLSLTLPDTGDAPLHVAFSSGIPNVEIVALLLSRGADQAQKNKFGHTPLENMVQLWRNGKLLEAIENRKSLADVAKLLQEGANPNTRHDNVDVLYTALTRNEFEIASLLLKHGANATKIYDFNNTMLHILNGDRTISKTILAVAQLLLDAGASLDVRNNLGQTPIDTAAARADKSLLHFLKSKIKE